MSTITATIRYCPIILAVATVLVIKQKALSVLLTRTAAVICATTVINAKDQIYQARLVNTLEVGTMHLFVIACASVARIMLRIERRAMCVAASTTPVKSRNRMAKSATKPLTVVIPVFKEMHRTQKGRL